MICGNDTLLILGSGLKQMIETQMEEERDLWDMCCLLLGTGNLLVWFGLLRYPCSLPNSDRIMF